MYGLGLTVELFHLINFVDQVANCFIDCHLRVFLRFIQNFKPVRFFELSQKQISVA